MYEAIERQQIKFSIDCFYYCGLGRHEDCWAFIKGKWAGLEYTLIRVYRRIAFLSCSALTFLDNRPILLVSR
jgi:hypothetical protein